MFLWKGEVIEIFGDEPKDKRTQDYVNGIFG